MFQKIINVLAVAYLVPLLVVVYMYMSTAIPSLMELNLKLWEAWQAAWAAVLEVVRWSPK